MNISSIRDGLKTRLQTISGLRCYDVLPDGFAPPAALVPGDDRRRVVATTKEILREIEPRAREPARAARR